MKTPLGWARANLMYDKLDKPPKAGSLLEVLCLLIQMRRQLMHLLEVHTVVQAVLVAQSDSHEAAQDAFRNFRSSVLPFLEEEFSKEKNDLVMALREEVARGPMAVRELHTKGVSSRLRQKLSDRGRKWKAGHDSLPKMRLPPGAGLPGYRGV